MTAAEAVTKITKVLNALPEDVRAKVLEAIRVLYGPSK